MGPDVTGSCHPPGMWWVDQILDGAAGRKAATCLALVFAVGFAVHSQLVQQLFMALVHYKAAAVTHELQNILHQVTTTTVPHAQPR